MKNNKLFFFKTVVLILFIAIFVFSSNFVSRADEEEVIIKASELSNLGEDNSIYREMGRKSKTTLIMDVDLTLNGLSGEELIIKGTKTLTVKGDIRASKLVIERGATVFIDDGRLITSYDIVVKQNATLKINLNSLRASGVMNGGMEAGEAIFTHGNIESAGNVYINSNYGGIRTTRYIQHENYYDENGNYNPPKFIIKGGVFSVKSSNGVFNWCQNNELYIYDGDVSFVSNGGIMEGFGNISVYGGKLFTNCLDSDAYIECGVFTDKKLSVYGGRIECVANKPRQLVSFDELYLAEGYGITVPKRAKIVGYEKEYEFKASNVGSKTILDENEEKVTRIVIEKKNTSNYKNEWVDGDWYDENGKSDYKGVLTWKSNSTGWWVEDSLGWYPQSQWVKIDGKWYYFLESGYMDYGEYRDGYWLGNDGAMLDGYYGEWKSDSLGWWFEDSSGWYPSSQWLWINGKCYYFESNGYLAVNKYVDGYWVGADGASY